MEQRKAFVFKNEWKTAFEIIHPESAKRLLLAAIHYSEDGTECSFEYMEEEAVWGIMKKSIDKEKGGK